MFYPRFFAWKATKVACAKDKTSQSDVLPPVGISPLGPVSMCPSLVKIRKDGHKDSKQLAIN